MAACRGFIYTRHLAAEMLKSMAGTSADFTEFLKRDIARWAKVIKDSGATAD